MLRLLSVLAVLAVPALSLADDALVGGPCDAASDCPLAFTCESVEMPCAPVACDSCACAPCPDDGSECPPCDCSMGCPEADDCTPTSEQRCVLHPQACESDADCTTPGFGCYPGGEMCSGGGSCDCPPCAEGEECAPCDCQEEEEVCEPAGPGMCLPADVPCTDDASCEAGWSCVDVGGSGGGDSSCGCACPTCAPGEPCEPCDCGCDEEEVDDEPASTAGICLPPGWEEQLPYFGGAEADDGKGVPGSPNDMEAGGSASDGGGSIDRPATGCSAAGGGAGSLLAFAAALGVLRRRR